MTKVLKGQGFDNCVAFLTVPFETPISCALHLCGLQGECSSQALILSNFFSIDADILVSSILTCQVLLC
jgi:hypothetical protein